MNRSQRVSALWKMLVVLTLTAYVGCQSNVVPVPIPLPDPVIPPVVTPAPIGGTPTAPPALNHDAVVQFMQPLVAVSVTAGSPVEIRLKAGCESESSTLQLRAVGDTTTTMLITARALPLGVRETSFIWDTTAAAAGACKLRATVVTAGGKSATVDATGVVTIDRNGHPAGINLISPTTGSSATRGALIDIQWDDGQMSGAKVDVVATMNGHDYPLVEDRDASLGGPDDGTVWDTSAYPAGNYQLSAKLKDSSGAYIAESAIRPFVPLAVNTLPTFIWVFPNINFTINEGQRVDVTWKIQDDDNTVVSIFGQQAGGGAIPIVSGLLIPRSATSQTLTRTWDTTMLPAGSYTIFATVDDAVNSTQTITASGIVKIIPRNGTGPGPMNAIPTLTLFTPATSLTFTQGTSNTFTVSWSDTDPDDNAKVFIKADPDLTPENGNEVAIGVPKDEDKDGPDDIIQFNTSVLQFIPAAATQTTYRVYGIIDDQTSLPGHRVISFAPGVINIVKSTANPNNATPNITVSAPTLNRAVIDTDVVPIRFTFGDTDVLDKHRVTVMLDKDRNPLNDSVDNNDANGVPRLPTDPNYLFIIADTEFAAGLTGTVNFTWVVDASQIPPRTDVDAQGRPLPYFVRVTVHDFHTNPSGQIDHRASGYASGVITVQKPAVPDTVNNVIDLKDVGGIVAGCVFQGFSPNTKLGGEIVNLARAVGGITGVNPGDFDQDGTADFLMVANGAQSNLRAGGPTDPAGSQLGRQGEAYMLMGHRRLPHPVVNYPFGRLGYVYSTNSIRAIDPRNAGPLELSGARFLGPDGIISDPSDPSYVPSGVTSAAALVTVDNPPLGCVAAAPWVRKSSFVLGLERTRNVNDLVDDDPNDDATIVYTDSFPYHADPSPKRGDAANPDSQGKSGRTGLAIYVDTQAAVTHCKFPPPAPPTVPQDSTTPNQLNLDAVGQGGPAGARFRGAMHLNTPPNPGSAVANGSFGGGGRVLNLLRAGAMPTYNDQACDDFTVNGPTLISCATFQQAEDMMTAMAFQGTIELALFGPDAANPNAPATTALITLTGVPSRQTPFAMSDGGTPPLPVNEYSCKPNLSVPYNTATGGQQRFWIAMRPQSNFMPMMGGNNPESCWVSSRVVPAGSPPPPAVEQDAYYRNFLATPPPPVGTWTRVASVPAPMPPMGTMPPPPTNPLATQVDLAFKLTFGDAIDNGFPITTGAVIAVQNRSGGVAAGNNSEAVDDFTVTGFNTLLDTLVFYSAESMAFTTAYQGTVMVAVYASNAAGTAPMNTPISAARTIPATKVPAGTLAGGLQLYQYSCLPRVSIPSPGRWWVGVRPVAGTAAGATAAWVASRSSASVNMNGGVESFYRSPATGSFAAASTVAGSGVTVPCDLAFAITTALQPEPNNGFGRNGQISAMGPFVAGLPNLILSTPDAAVRDLDGVVKANAGAVTVYIGQNWAVAAQVASNAMRFVESFPEYAPVSGCVTDRATNLLFPARLQIVGQAVGDHLGNGADAGDFNHDSVRDVLVTAPNTSRPLPTGGPSLTNNGAAFILLIPRVLPPTIRLGGAQPVQRIEIIGARNNDEFGRRTAFLNDLNGDSVPDVAIGSPRWHNAANEEVGGIAILFGQLRNTGEFGYSTDDIATAQLPGCVIMGNTVGGQVGGDVRLAGDFNGDGKLDLLIAAPGESRVIMRNGAPETRLGVVYLIYGGNHLFNRRFTLSQVGDATGVLPGVVIVSPFAQGSPDAAPVTVASGIGDLDGDGFDDIALGAPTANFVNIVDPSQNRPQVGEVYVVYGNREGSNNFPPPPP